MSDISNQKKQILSYDMSGMTSAWFLNGSAKQRGGYEFNTYGDSLEIKNIYTGEILVRPTHYSNFIDPNLGSFTSIESLRDYCAQNLMTNAL